MLLADISSSFCLNSVVVSWGAGNEHREGAGIGINGHRRNAVRSNGIPGQLLAGLVNEPLNLFDHRLGQAGQVDNQTVGGGLGVGAIHGAPGGVAARLVGSTGVMPGRLVKSFTLNV